MKDPQEEIAALKAALEEAEAARKAEQEARQAFVSLVAHELRAPMTSIKGYTDLLLKGIMGPLNEAQTDFLTTIRANVDRMAKLVANLADINKLEGQHLSLTYEAVSVPATLEEVLATLNRALQEKRITYQAHVSDGLPPVWADRERLAQILHALLENAIQYTPADGTITVKAEPAPGDVGQVQISVEDTGFGIPEAEQVHIFEMFFRASDEKTRETPGNGLSLHLSRQLAELQGGALWFESEPGVGSTFYLRLPAAP